MKHMRFLRASLVAAYVTFTVAGCGGGGGSSGDTDPPPDGTPPPQTFNLTATVKDLNSEGLMLAFNGTPVSVASGASTVTLGTALSVGTAYTVSVQSQPTGQTCSVDNGSGTMPASDVTNVAITCSLNTYAVGGIVNDLTAGELVLVNNGGDATSVAAGAIQFQMNTRLAQGESYAISVRTQPEGLSCSVSNESGVVEAADINSVEINCTTSVERVVYDFAENGEVGFNPRGALIQGRGDDDNFYGTTTAGGTNQGGTVFRMSPSGDVTELYSPVQAEGDVEREITLIQARDGTFYGTTATGGQNKQGSVFRMKLNASGDEVEELTELHSFGESDSDGRRPMAALVEAEDGVFYGTTELGGINITEAHRSGGGTVFKVSASGDVTVVYSFGEKPDDPTGPHAALVPAGDGTFYGTTVQTSDDADGTVVDNGTVFRMTVSGNEVQVKFVHFFSLLEGVYPFAALVPAGDGTFYGTALFGGEQGRGTVFKMKVPPDLSEQYEVEAVHSFGQTEEDGVSPNALIQALDGNFYSTTSGGGAHDLGTVFQVSASGEVKVVYSFGGEGDENKEDDGAFPFAALLQVRDGNLYGTTREGGKNGVGTIFRIVAP